MPSNAIPEVRCVAFMPRSPMAVSCPFRVPGNAEVNDLAEAIAAHRNFKRYLEHDEPFLLKLLLFDLREHDFAKGRRDGGGALQGRCGVGGLQERD